VTPPRAAAADLDLDLYDLSAAANAALAEAIERPFRFTYKGVIYELPNQKLWPLSAMEDTKGDIGTFLTGIGAKPEVYEGLAAAGLVVGELHLLMEAAAADAGVGNLPNSKRPARPGSTRT
jgi:hypothetical protein